jgi:hypothetical protein
MNNPKEILHGWYSAKAAHQYGTSIYKSHANPDIEMTVTLVTVTKDASCYGWDDVVYVGEICGHVRNHPGTDKMFAERRTDNYKFYGYEY